MAPPVAARARSSSTCPSSTNTRITAADSKYSPGPPSMPRIDAGNNDGASTPTTLKPYAAPEPSAISVNMFGLR
jgi:hypothetical protein